MLCALFAFAAVGSVSARPFGLGARQLPPGLTNLFRPSCVDSADLYLRRSHYLDSDLDGRPRLDHYGPALLIASMLNRTDHADVDADPDSQRDLDDRHDCYSGRQRSLPPAGLRDR